MDDADAQLGKAVVEALLTMVNGGPPITGEKADMALEYISILEYDEAAGRDRIEDLEEIARQRERYIARLERVMDDEGMKRWADALGDTNG